MATTESAVNGDTQTIRYPDGVSKTWTGRSEGARTRRVLKDYEVTKDGQLVQKFYFRSGAFRSYTLDPNTPMKDEGFEGLTLIQVAASHGLTQKFGDELAVPADKWDEDDALEWTDSMAERLADGRWGAERVGGPGGTGVLFRALVELKQKNSPGTSDEDARVYVRDFLKGKSDDEKQALKVKGPGPLLAIIKRLEEEKAKNAPKIDTSRLMEGF